MVKYITKDGLNALSQYKYTGVDNSFLANLFMKHYWNWATETFFPTWFAPNLVTLLGFLCLISNFLLAVFYFPDLIGQVPWWMFLFWSSNIFLYQTFDNVDGKQARRTGSSSPLGELFDHGTDTLFVLLTGPALWISTSSSHWYMFWQLIVGSLAFFFSHWEEYYTNELILGKYANPTEVQLSIIGFIMAGFLFGQSFYLQKIRDVLPGFVSTLLTPLNAVSVSHFLDWELRDLVNIVVAAGTIWAAISNVFVTYKFVINKYSKLGNFNFGVLWDPVLKAFPCVAHLGLASAWGLYSHSNIVENQIVLFLVLNGFISSYIVDQLMICRICKMNFIWYNPILIFPLLGFVNGVLAPKPIIPESIFLPVLVLVLMVVYWTFIVSVINQLTTHLGIRTFKIKPKAAVASGSTTVKSGDPKKVVKAKKI
jgi:ethanolaminephosphotransferase